MNIRRFLFLVLSLALFFAVSACNSAPGYYREGSVNPPASRALESRVTRQSPVETAGRRFMPRHRQHVNSPANQANSRHSEPAIPNVGNRSMTAAHSEPANIPQNFIEDSTGHYYATPSPSASRYPVEVSSDSILIVKPPTVPPFNQPEAPPESMPSQPAQPSPQAAAKQTPTRGHSPSGEASTQGAHPANDARATHSTNRELGSHTTEFNAKEENRVTNITRASNSINGHIVKPGETFSYNQTVGPTIERRGYKKGIIFVDGEKKEGFGGGVCQVSTTLSIAADNAGMTITERHDHSLPVSYAEEGEEAATSYGVIDFKFKNEKSFPVVIHSSVQGGSISVSISEA